VLAMLLSASAWTSASEAGAQADQPLPQPSVQPYL